MANFSNAFSNLEGGLAWLINFYLHMLFGGGPDEIIEIQLTVGQQKFQSGQSEFLSETHFPKFQSGA